MLLKLKATHLKHMCMRIIIRNISRDHSNQRAQKIVAMRRAWCNHTIMTARSAERVRWRHAALCRVREECGDSHANTITIKYTLIFVLIAYVCKNALNASEISNIYILPYIFRSRLMEPLWRTYNLVIHVCICAVNKRALADVSPSSSSWSRQPETLTVDDSVISILRSPTSDSAKDREDDKICAADIVPRRRLVARDDD